MAKWRAGAIARCQWSTPRSAAAQRRHRGLLRVNTRESPHEETRWAARSRPAADGGTRVRDRGRTTHLGSEGVVHGNDSDRGPEARQRADHPVAAVFQEEAEEAIPVSRHGHQVELPERRSHRVDAAAHRVVRLPLVVAHRAVVAHAAAEAGRGRPRLQPVQEVVVQVLLARHGARDHLVGRQLVAQHGSLSRRVRDRRDVADAEGEASGRVRHRARPAAAAEQSVVVITAGDKGGVLCALHVGTCTCMAAGKTRCY